MTALRTTTMRSHEARVTRLRRGGLLAPALLLLALPGAPVLAAAEDEPDPTVEETVVVTASRIDQREADVAANVTVLTEEEIARSASLVTDEMLRRVPGFSLFRRASSLVAHPTTQGVSLRGIGPSGVSRTLVLLDGIPLNDPFGGWIYWSRVPLSQLERVELVRGGASNVWGNSALGGVIHLFTRDPARSTFQAGLAGGSHDTFQVDLMASQRWQKSAAEIHGDLFDSDGFYVVAPEDRGAIDIPADSEHWNLGGRVDVAGSESWTVSIRAGAFDEDRGNGTPLTRNDTEAASGSVQVRAVSGRSEWRASVYGHDQSFASSFSSQAQDRSSEVPALDQFDVDSQALGLGLQWVRPFEGERAAHVLTAGLEGRDADGTNLEDFRLVGGTFANRRRAGGDQGLYGAFLQDTASFGDRFQLQIGVRGDRWEATDGFRIETLLATGAVTREERPPDRDETEWSPRLAVLWKPRQGVGIKASAYEAFRAPTINELYRPFRVRNDITEANAGLVPETLTGLELGADFRGRRVSLKLNAFWNEVEDAIANVTVGLGPGTVQPCGFVPAGGVCRQRQNLEKTEIDGAEVELEVTPKAGFRFAVSYLYSDPEVIHAPQQPEIEGHRLAQVPENQASVALEWNQHRHLGVSLLARYVGDQYEDDLSSLKLASVVVTDLAFQIPVDERWGAFIAFENLFDEEIESGRTADGLVTVATPFIAHGGVRIHFGPR